MKTTGFFCVLVFCTLPASGADLWPRTKHPLVPRERETLQALYRAMEGTADSVDELLVRVSIVDVAKGKDYEDPLTLVYVLRARRLLGLPRLAGDDQLLRSVSDREGSSEAASLAAVELARIYRQAGEGDRARVELDRALRSAWRSETRIEAHLMRGWLAVEGGDLPRARADFRATLAFDLGRSQLALSLTSLAWVELLRGDVPEARRLLARARDISSDGARVGTDPLDRPELMDRDRLALRDMARRLASVSERQ